MFPGLRKLSRGGKAGEGVPRVVGGAISMQVHPRSLPLHPGTRDTVTHPPMHIKHRSHLSFIFISWKNFRRWTLPFGYDAVVILESVTAVYIYKGLVKGVSVQGPLSIGKGVFPELKIFTDPKGQILQPTASLMSLKIGHWMLPRFFNSPGTKPSDHIAADLDKGSIPDICVMICHFTHLNS